MSESKVTVETSNEEEPKQVIVRGGRFHFIKTLAAIYLSRKFIVTLTFGYLIYVVYWGAVRMVFSVENPDQIRALTQMFNVTMGIFGSIALGYLGFSRTSSSLQTYVNQSFSSRNERGDSTKDED